MATSQEKRDAADKRAAKVKDRNARQIPALNKERADYVRRAGLPDTDPKDASRLKDRAAQVEREITARGGKVEKTDKADEKAADKAAKADDAPAKSEDK